MLQAPGDDAPAAEPRPGPTGMPLLARVADEVPDDQEVPGVLHLLDHRDFVDQAPLVLVERVAQGVARHQGLQPRQPRREALAHHVLEVACRR